MPRLFGTLGTISDFNHVDTSLGAKFLTTPISQNLDEIIVRSRLPGFCNSGRVHFKLVFAFFCTRPLHVSLTACRQCLFPVMAGQWRGVESDPSI